MYSNVMYISMLNEYTSFKCNIRIIRIIQFKKLYIISALLYTDTTTTFLFQRVEQVCYVPRLRSMCVYVFRSLVCSPTSLLKREHTCRANAVLQLQPLQAKQDSRCNSKIVSCSYLTRAYRFAVLRMRHA